MKRINELTKNFFNALNQLRGVDEKDEPSPELVHTRLRALIDGIAQQGAELGMLDRDLQDITYALVALADERALAMSENMHRYWMANMLQLRYFQENVAGDGFFTRLDGLRRDPRRIDVLQIYYLCLLFGFQGRFAIRGGDIELANLIEALRAELGQALEIPDELSPSAARPDDAVGRARGRAVLWVSAGAIVLTVSLYVALRFSIAYEAAPLREPPTETAR